MPPTAQIRLLTARDTASTRLQMTQSVTLLLINSKPPTLPTAPVTTIIRNAPLSALLTPAFLSDNVVEPGRTVLVGHSLSPRPAHMPCVVVLPTCLLLTCPRNVLPSLGLPPIRSKLAVRQQLPAVIRMPFPFKSVKPSLISEARLGTCDLTLSCGTATVRPPRNLQADCRRLEPDVRHSVCKMPDLHAILSANDQDDTMLMLEHLQAICMDIAVECPDLPVSDSRVCRVHYAGLCNHALSDSLLECAKLAVCDGASAAIVLARAPPVLGAWKNSVDVWAAGMRFEAAELFIVTESGVYVAQFSPPL